MSNGFGYRHDDQGDLVPQLGHSRAPRHLWTPLETSAFDSGAGWKQQQIIELLTQIRDEWERMPAMNFRHEMTKVIEQVGQQRAETTTEAPCTCKCKGACK